MVVSGFTQRNSTILGINPGHFDEAVTNRVGFLKYQQYEAQQKPELAGA